MTDELQNLLERHARLVEVSGDAWVKMCAAQEVCRLARDAEHKSAEAIEEYIKRQIEPMIGDIDEKFRPVAIEVALDLNP